MTILWGLKCRERLFERKKVDTTIKEGRKKKVMYIYQCLKDTICIMLQQAIVQPTTSMSSIVSRLPYPSEYCGRTVYHDPFRYADETGVGTA